MDIHELKQALKETGDSDVQQVIFDLPEQANVNQEKDYPIVLWDLNSLRFVKNLRANGGAVDRTVTVSVYIIGYFDKLAQDQADEMTQKWRDLESDFKTYIQELNANNDSLHVTEEDIEGEYYDVGVLSIDQEIGVGQSVTIDTYCTT